MFDRVLNTPLVLRNMLAFAFVWDFLNKIVIPFLLQLNVYLRQQNHPKYLNYLKCPKYLTKNKKFS